MDLSDHTTTTLTLSDEIGLFHAKREIATTSAVVVRVVYMITFAATVLDTTAETGWGRDTGVR